jgi:hypothetical protein
MYAGMVFAKAIIFLLGIGGVALIRWNRSLSDANVAANRAGAESLGFGPLQRLLARPWIAAYSRVVIVVVGIAWIAMSAIVLVFAHW